MTPRTGWPAPPRPGGTPCRSSRSTCAASTCRRCAGCFGDVRRRATRDKYGRRGRSGDPEYGIKHLIERNLETLSPDQFAKIINTLDSDPDGQQIALAWIARPDRARLPDCQLLSAYNR